MSNKHTSRDLSDKAVKLVAARFHTLGDPSRLKLLIAIKKGEKNVTELVAATGLGQPNVSKHLQLLIEAGIVTRRREVRNVFYRIADRRFFALFELASLGLQERLVRQVRVFAK